MLHMSFLFKLGHINTCLLFFFSRGVGGLKDNKFPLVFPIKPQQSCKYEINTQIGLQACRKANLNELKEQKNKKKKQTKFALLKGSYDLSGCSVRPTNSKQQVHDSTLRKKNHTLLFALSSFLSLALTSTNKTNNPAS